MEGDQQPDDRHGGAVQQSKEYRAVKLKYSGDAPSAKSGFMSGSRGVDLSEVNDLVQEGWEVHTFSHDEDGCWQEAIMVRGDDSE